MPEPSGSIRRPAAFLGMLWGMRRTCVASLALLLLVGPPGPAAAQDEAPGVSVTVDGPRLLVGTERGVGGRVTLDDAADVRLRVTDFDGRTVRELGDRDRDAGTFPWAWRGVDDAGRPLPSGPYRIVATAGAEGRSSRAEAWVAIADRKIYPVRPGFITVAVDPGHGGSYDGAVGADGTREADLNLDIGLRLSRMLEAAGVNVVITRTTDGHVNEPPEDRSGDGVIDDTDELAARPDLANEARADLFISVHNNIAVNESVGGPSTFYYDERPFGDRSERLARIIQAAMVSALGEIGSDGWEPYDHGALVYPYYVLRGYDPPRLRRPTQMPGVLSEGMFLSNPRELRYLKRPAVRGAMAAAYYEAIARYLAGRDTHVGYEFVSGPVGPVVAGEPVRYEVEVRNQGTQPMRGWRLEVSALPAPSRYVGRDRRGDRVGEARVPTLRPGQGRVVSVEVSAPAPGQEWMLLFDARDRGGLRASRMGSPMLQERLTTVDPVEPSVEPSIDPSAPPTAVAGEPSGETSAEPPAEPSSSDTA